MLNGNCSDGELCVSLQGNRDEGTNVDMSLVQRDVQVSIIQTSKKQYITLEEKKSEMLTALLEASLFLYTVQ